MHYRNGREAKNGDKVIQLDFHATRIASVGVLFDAMPNNDCRDGSIATILPSGVHAACICDCLHIDDVLEMLKEKGLDKRPAGK